MLSQVLAVLGFLLACSNAAPNLPVTTLFQSTTMTVQSTSVMPSTTDTPARLITCFFLRLLLPFLTALAAINYCLNKRNPCGYHSVCTFVADREYTCDCVAGFVSASGTGKYCLFGDCASSFVLLRLNAGKKTPKPTLTPQAVCVPKFCGKFGVCSVVNSLATCTCKAGWFSQTDDGRNCLWGVAAIVVDAVSDLLLLLLLQA